MSEPGPSEKQAYRIDSIRQGADGTFFPLIESVFMIVAISFFGVGDFWKGLIAASNFIGFLLSAPLTGLLNRTDIRRSRILAFLTFLSSSALIAAITTSDGRLYALAATLASAAFHVRQPFFTDLYGEVYPAERRARRISLGLRLQLLMSVSLGLLYGRLLEADLEWWRWIFLTAAAAIGSSALMMLRLPQRKVRPREESWLQAMAIPFRNPVFLYVQASWMILGFGNLWTLPLRAVYLAETERGLGLSPVTVMLMLVVIPTVMKLSFNPLWARLYHRLSFPALRLAINFFFAASIPLFFISDRLWIIAIATVLYGIGTSGSPFIWQLWVTKLALPAETRLYQSAHAFLAGIRGVVAPFVGLAVLQGLGFREMGFISFGLAVAASLMMLPLLHPARRF